MRECYTVNRAEETTNEAVPTRLSVSQVPARDRVRRWYHHRHELGEVGRNPLSVGDLVRQASVGDGVTGGG